jgi:hypothetical protein
VGLLAWPGISASAVLQAPIAAATAAAGTAAVLAALALQAGVGCLVVLLLLAAAAAAAEFGWQIVRGQATSDVVVKFGCHLGCVCSFQVCQVMGGTRCGGGGLCRVGRWCAGSFPH